MIQNLTSPLSHATKPSFNYAEINFLEKGEPLDLRFLKSVPSLEFSAASHNSTPLEKSKIFEEVSFRVERNLQFLLKKALIYYPLLSYKIYGQAIFVLLLYRYTRQKQFGIRHWVILKDREQVAYETPILAHLFSYDFEEINTIMDIVEQLYAIQCTTPQPMLNESYLFIDEIEDSLTQPAIKIRFLQDINDEMIQYTLKYKTDKIDPLLLKNFIETYQWLYQIVLEELCISKNQKKLSSLVSYPLLSQENYEKVIQLWNATECAYPSSKMAHHLFEEQVEKTPRHIAVVCEDVQLTYQELNEKANQLAHYLRINYQIKGDDLIALCLDRNEQMIIAILAVWKVGGAYVPMDPSYPNERIGYIMEDTQAKVIITLQTYGDRLKQIISLQKTDRFSSKVFEIDGVEEKNMCALQALQNPQTPAVSTDLAYVIYTSGTTGQPKGVMIEHKSVVNLHFSLCQKYDVRKIHEDVILQSSNYVFDSSIEDIVLSILNGCKLVMLSARLRTEIGDFYDYLNNQKVTYIGSTPSFFQQYDLDKIRSLKKISVGGEKVTQEFATKAGLNNHINIINGYGPTETTVTAVTHSFREHPTLAIGRPIANTQCYVLDSDLAPLPIGAIGELYVGGVGLARGYLNRPDLTTEKFISNPFQTEEETKDISHNLKGRNARLYKTGDLVRWLPDGTLEYIGRNDAQIKMRGYRIELGEIETALESYQGIKQSIVLMKQRDEGHQYLVAYYTKNITLDYKDSEEYVNNWKALYQSYYDNLDINNYKSNMNIWTSSYTEQAIPQEDMFEWVEETVKRIEELNPQVILEIGSGSGLILFNTINTCTYYYATDFSENVVDYTKKVIDRFNYKHKVKALRCSAEAIPYQEIDQAYDTVILNSVVLHFPDTNYLEKVIADVIHHMAPSGQIFIGDIIDHRLLRCFLYSIQSYKKNTVNKEEIDHLITRYKDLSISPAYFLSLKNFHPSISDIEIMPKIGRADHEMNNYRYDVILHIRKQRNDPQERKTSTLNKRYIKENQFIEADNLIDYLNQFADQETIFFKYPNKRIIKDYQAVNLFYNTSFNKNLKNTNTILHINDILEEAHEKEFRFKFFLDVNDPLYFYVVLYKNAQEKFYCDYLAQSSDLKTTFSNNPLKSHQRVEHDFSHKLKNYLQRKLPSYMVPSYYILLDTFPLTLNGKLNVKALPDPYIFNDDNYISPRNELEKNICRIWSDVLKIDEEKLGICDDFFGLGGNSILAIKVINRLNNDLHKTLNTTALFEYRTIQKLSDFLCIYKENVTILPSSLSTSERPILSSGQERLWFIHQYAQGTNVYNIPMIFKLSEYAHLDFFKESIQKIILRHEILRTYIRQDEKGNLYQHVINAQEIHLDIPTVTVFNKAQLDHELAKASNHIYDLSTAHPIKVKFYKLKEEHFDKIHYYLSIIIHHIAFDGWSGDIFLRELKQFYQECFSKNKGISFILNLPNLEIQYKDFALWQKQNYGEANEVNKQLDYWKTTLADYENLNLMTDYTRPSEINYHGHSLSFEVSEKTSACLRQLAKNLKISLYSVLLSGYYLMLRAYSNQNDIIIGTPIANRNHHQLQNLIGFFVNTLVLRTHIDSYQTLKNFILKVSKEVMKVQLNQDVPFDKLVQELNVERDTSRNPIFQVMFDIQNFADDTQDIPHDEKEENLDNLLQVYTPDINPLDIAPFDLSTSIDDRGKNLKGIFNYATSLYTPETISRFIETYQVILRQLAALTYDQEKLENLKIKDITYLTPLSQNLICQKWNTTERPYPHHKTLHQLFEEQVEVIPNQVAVVYEEVTLTYHELNEKANQLAHYLLSQHKIQADDLIILCLERSEQMIISMLAILKAGGAYVPLDPGYPDERLRYMVYDTQAKIIITNHIYENRLKQLLSINNQTIHIIPLGRQDFLHQIASQPKYNLQIVTDSKDLAYVIYTSGTTGRPKGVMIEHKSVVNSSYNAILHRKVDTTSKVLNVAPYIFDSSVLDIYTTLLAGAQLFILPEELRRDIFQINTYSTFNNITHLFLTTRLAEEFLTLNDIVPSLVCLTTAGEKLGKVKKFDFDIINEYGPTEACVCSTQFRIIQNNDTISIGGPIYNATTYVLDNHFNALPVGAIGELYIGGDGLARGYLGRPDLTAERFITNPFQKSELIQEIPPKFKKCDTRLYKTGDLVRWLPNGLLEYIGRNDFQVKIRGYRIELGDIEAALSEFNGIKQSVVLAKDYASLHDQGKNSHKYLVGYYVAEKPLDDQTIIKYLQTRLPDYMIPQILIYLETLPLTLNGKLNREALPHPNFNIQKQHIAPRNELEASICQIWSEVLGIEQVGIQDDFFRLGGNSILTIQLVSKLRQRLNLNVHIKDIFTYKSVQNFSHHLLNDVSLHPTEAPPLFVSSMMSQNPDFEPFVLLNEDTSTSPSLFIFPPAEGGAESYFNNLVPALSNCKLIIFNNYYLYLTESDAYKEAANFLTYEKLAADYIKYVKAIQPLGPYTLCGWSFGGNLAFEIAKQLAEQGDLVISIILIDTFFSPLLSHKETTIDNFNNTYSPRLKKEINIPVILFKAIKSNDTKANHIEKYVKDENLEIILMPHDHYSWIHDKSQINEIAYKMVSSAQST